MQSMALTAQENAPTSMTVGDGGASQAQAMVLAQFAMADRRPRNMASVVNRLNYLASRPSYAESAVYALPRGGKQIEGLSIRAAEAIANAYGNIRFGSNVVSETGEYVYGVGWACDLETNAYNEQAWRAPKTIERKSKDAKSVVVGQRINSFGETVFIIEAPEGEMRVTANSEASRAVRTAILRVIPADVQEDFMKACKAKAKSRDKSDPEDAKRRVLGAFNDAGISSAQLSAYTRLDLSGDISQHLDRLRALFASVRDGEITAAEIRSGGKEVEAGPSAAVSKARAVAAKRAKRTPDPEPEVVDAQVEDVPEEAPDGDDGQAAFGFEGDDI